MEKIKDQATDGLTMTTEEACNLLRSAGFRIDVETLREGIKQGAFPFGVAIKRSNWVFFIYRKQLFEFLRERGAEV